MKDIVGISLFLSFVWVASCDKPQPSGVYTDYERASLRYYAYAPPTIPHKVLNRDCLDCHAQGLVVEGRKAPVTPHPELVNCMQCHIRPNPDVTPFRNNQFVGLPEPASIKFPQPNGPPLMPHRLFMRENCLICHNDATRKGVTQTTHPERTNCLQCHISQDSTFRVARRNE